MTRKKRLNFNSPAPDLTVLDLEGKPVQLSSLWAEKPLLLAFTRHFGCTQCKEMLDELALDEEPITRFDLLINQLPEAAVQSLTGRTITEISDKGVTVLDHHGRKTLIEADSVVIALGTKSVETLAEKAKDIVPEVFVIGDSKKPRKIIDATYEGAAIARLI